MFDGAAGYYSAAHVSGNTKENRFWFLILGLRSIRCLTQNEWRFMPGLAMKVGPVFDPRPFGRGQGGAQLRDTPKKPKPRGPKACAQGFHGRRLVATPLPNPSQREGDPSFCTVSSYRNAWSRSRSPSARRFEGAMRTYGAKFGWLVKIPHIGTANCSPRLSDFNPSNNSIVRSMLSWS